MPNKRPAFNTAVAVHRGRNPHPLRKSRLIQNRDTPVVPSAPAARVTPRNDSAMHQQQMMRTYWVEQELSSSMMHSFPEKHLSLTLCILLNGNNCDSHLNKQTTIPQAVLFLLVLPITSQSILIHQLLHIQAIVLVPSTVSPFHGFPH